MVLDIWPHGKIVPYTIPSQLSFNRDVVLPDSVIETERLSVEQCALSDRHLDASLS